MFGSLQCDVELQLSIDVRLGLDKRAIGHAARWTDGRMESGNISWRGSARLSPEIVAQVARNSSSPHHNYISPTILHTRESGILSVIF